MSFSSTHFPTMACLRVLGQHTNCAEIGFLQVAQKKLYFFCFLLFFFLGSANILLFDYFRKIFLSNFIILIRSKCFGPRSYNNMKGLLSWLLWKPVLLFQYSMLLERFQSIFDSGSLWLPKEWMRKSFRQKVTHVYYTLLTVLYSHPTTQTLTTANISNVRKTVFHLLGSERERERWTDAWTLKIYKWGARVRAQLVNCLLWNPEDTSLIPKMHMKKQGMVIGNHNPSAGAGVVGTGRSLGLDHQPVWPNWWVSSQ